MGVDAHYFYDLLRSRLDFNKNKQMAQMYVSARRLVGSQEALSTRVNEPLQSLIGRILYVLDSAWNAQRTLTEEETNFLMQAWVDSRYRLVDERFLVGSIAGDYCTLLFGAAARSPLASASPQELATAVAALGAILGAQWPVVTQE